MAASFSSHLGVKTLVVNNNDQFDAQGRDSEAVRQVEIMTARAAALALGFTYKLDSRLDMADIC